MSLLLLIEIIQNESWLLSCLVELVGLDGGGGVDVEGLEVHAAVREHHAAGLLAERRHAAAHQLQLDALPLVLQPSGVEPLVLLVLLATNVSTDLS